MKLKLIVTISIAGLLLSPAALGETSDAARLYFDAVTAAASGSEIVVHLLAVSPQPINAVSAEIQYSGPIKFLALNDSGTLINFWQTKENHDASETINLEGGMIRPFSGSKGEIVDLVFSALGEGRAEILINRGAVYYADGRGTAMTLTPSKIEIEIVAGNQKNASSAPADKISPSFDSVSTVENPSHDGFLAVFDARDAASGVAHYYLRSKKWFLWSDWQEVKNPAELPPDIWSYQIAVEDYSGNRTEKTVYLEIKIVKLLFELLAFFIFFLSGYYIIKRWVSPKFIL